jgi:hypothetical protein
MALRPGSLLLMSSHFMPRPRSSMISVSSSGDHLDCFLAGGSVPSDVDECRLVPARDMDTGDVVVGLPNVVVVVVVVVASIDGRRDDADADADADDEGEGARGLVCCCCCCWCNGVSSSSSGLSSSEISTLAGEEEMVMGWCRRSMNSSCVDTYKMIPMRTTSHVNHVNHVC